MIKYYLKFALRNILRQRVYSIINILGLAIGFAIFLIIVLYVKNEYSYDKHNLNYKNIYRMEFGDWCVIPPGFAHILNGQIPEINKFTRAKYTRNVLFTYKTGEQNNASIDITAKHTFGVDSTFFEIFDAEFISGSASNSLKEPLTIVLTESLAKRIFGNEDAFNKVLRMNNFANMKVVGVIKDPPNSHFMSDAFFSVTSYNIFQGEGHTNNLTSSNYLTYFLTNKGFDASRVRTKIFDFFGKYEQSDILNEGASERFIVFRPLKDIYFFKEAQYENGIKHGNKPIVNSFIIIAIFILLIAGINFINLTTARALLRAKEVGIKKVAGSFRSNLIFQFLLESAVITIIAMLFALTLLQLIIPEFNNLVSTELSFKSILSPTSILEIISITLIIGIFSGLYPAFHLSYFNPTAVLKGEITSGKAAGTFRKTLISFQFIIASILISGTLMVNEQVLFLKNKDLGFTKEKIINFGLRRGVSENTPALKVKLLQNPNIKSVSFSHGIPGNTRNTNSFIWKDEYITSRVSSVDAEFFKIYNIEVLDGNLDMWKNDSKARNYVAINETLAKMTGWDQPIGKVINREGNHTNFMASSFKIVAVIKDYHLESLHTPVPPLVLCFDKNQHWLTSVKISGNNIQETIQFMESTWDEFSTGFPFEFTFLDQEFDTMYKSEGQTQKIAVYFSILAIFIACLGLFGLSAFMTQRRFKEIGIRKVLGSSIGQIVTKLSREFTVLVLISNIIAIPISFFILTKWLQDYPYHANINWWVFLISVFTTLVVALITVSFHSFKAAIENPVDAIRHE